jgi:hypothetical protein
VNDARTPETSTIEASADRFGWAVGLRLVGFITAAAAAAFMWLDSRAGWLDYQPGGTAFFTYVRPVFYLLLVLGAVAAIRWEFVGGVIAGFAAGAIGAIAVNQLVGRHAVLVIALLAVPASAWLLADLSGWSVRRGTAAFVATLVAVTAGSSAGEYIYERQFGPTHPASDLEALPDSATRWVWSGGVTSDAARVNARIAEPFETARLAVTTTDDFADATFHPLSEHDGTIVSFDVTDLEPDVRHRYAVEVDGELDRVRTGEFTTFPDGAASFSFTVGGCARVGSNGSVFDTIRAEDQLFHLIVGDFHYGDIPDDNRARYDEVIDLTLRQPAQAALYRSSPIAYVWDDHDYGINDSDFYSTSRVAAMEAYRANVPSYPLAGELSAVFQSFDVGRVRFLVTDARSAREPGETMLGASQLDWFLDELVTAAEEQELVVWVNPVPWVAEADEGADHWGGYDDERRLIADVIAEHDIDQLLMLSGDAHMVAIDDGTNTDYSMSGDAGFPLLHAAPLDRPGSIKGGPYSVGAVGESGQYGLVEIDDDGDTIRVSLRAKRYDGEVILRHDFVVGDD